MPKYQNTQEYQNQNEIIKTCELFPNLSNLFGSVSKPSIEANSHRQHIRCVRKSLRWLRHSEILPRASTRINDNNEVNGVEAQSLLFNDQRLSVEALQRKNGSKKNCECYASYHGMDYVGER
jgi:hypothetical protein